MLKKALWQLPPPVLRREVHFPEARSLRSCRRRGAVPTHPGERVRWVAFFEHAGAL